MLIRYFDLGLYRATELKWIHQILNDLESVQFELYGFEACKAFYDKILKDSEIKSMKNVKLYNLAISDHKGTLKLYHHKNRVGHSIYDTKNLISKDYEEVSCIKFSEWITECGINLDDSFNIMRMNIEGAEYPLFIDIIESGLRSKFAIFCGDGRDVSKIGEFKENGTVKKYYNMLKNENIVIHRYINFRIEGNVDMKKLIIEKLENYII